MSISWVSLKYYKPTSYFVIRFFFFHISSGRRRSLGGIAPTQKNAAQVPGTSVNFMLALKVPQRISLRRESTSPPGTMSSTALLRTASCRPEPKSVATFSTANVSPNSPRALSRLTSKTWATQPVSGDMPCRRAKSVSRRSVKTCLSPSMTAAYPHSQSADARAMR